MKTKTTKLLIIYSLATTAVAVLMTYQTVQLLESNTVLFTDAPDECVSLETQVRAMSTDDVNKLMIVVAETLTANYKEATREQVEKEHEAHANRLALQHMNDVMGVLVKSIGAMPTSTLPVAN